MFVNQPLPHETSGAAPSTSEACPVLANRAGERCVSLLHLLRNFLQQIHFFLECQRITCVYLNTNAYNSQPRCKWRTPCAFSIDTTNLKETTLCEAKQR